MKANGRTLVGLKIVVAVVALTAWSVSGAAGTPAAKQETAVVQHLDINIRGIDSYLDRTFFLTVGDHVFRLAEGDSLIHGRLEVAVHEVALLLDTTSEMEREFRDRYPRLYAVKGWVPSNESGTSVDADWRDDPATLSVELPLEMFTTSHTVRGRAASRAPVAISRCYHVWIEPPSAEPRDLVELLRSSSSEEEVSLRVHLSRQVHYNEEKEAIDAHHFNRTGSRTRGAVPEDRQITREVRIEGLDDQADYRFLAATNHVSDRERAHVGLVALDEEDSLLEKLAPFRAAAHLQDAHAAGIVDAYGYLVALPDTSSVEVEHTWREVDPMESEDLWDEAGLVRTRLLRDAVVAARPFNRFVDDSRLAREAVTLAVRLVDQPDGGEPTLQLYRSRVVQYDAAGNAYADTRLDAEGLPRQLSRTVYLGGLENYPELTFVVGEGFRSHASTPEFVNRSGGYFCAAIIEDGLELTGLSHRTRYTPAGDSSLYAVQGQPHEALTTQWQEFRGTSPVYFSLLNDSLAKGTLLDWIERSRTFNGTVDDERAHSEEVTLQIHIEPAQEGDEAASMSIYPARVVQRDEHRRVVAVRHYDHHGNELTEVPTSLPQYGPVWRHYELEGLEAQPDYAFVLVQQISTIELENDQLVTRTSHVVTPLQDGASLPAMRLWLLEGRREMAQDRPSGYSIYAVRGPLAQPLSYESLSEADPLKLELTSGQLRDSLERQPDAAGVDREILTYRVRIETDGEAPTMRLKPARLVQYDLDNEPVGSYRFDESGNRVDGAEPE